MIDDAVVNLLNAAATVTIHQLCMKEEAGEKITLGVALKEFDENWRGAVSPYMVQKEDARKKFEEFFKEKFPDGKLNERLEDLE